jgi:hypothetical protein
MQLYAIQLLFAMIFAVKTLMSGFTVSERPQS